MTTLGVGALALGVMVSAASCGSPDEPAEDAPVGEQTARPAVVPSQYFPAERPVFGVNPDWGAETVAEFAEVSGVSPGSAVSFVDLPWDDADVQNVRAAAEQVADSHGVLLLTIEPREGLEAVTADVIDELVAVLQDINEAGVPVLLRYAHEMNGSWYSWGQQPEAYVASFRQVAEAVQETPATEMLWAPNYGGGYPYTGGQYSAEPGSAEFAALDTDGDQELTERDDPYAPYYPGDDVVDWVGMTIYHWGDAHPWGSNDMPEENKFIEQLTGTYDGLAADDTAIPDFYTEYAVGRDKPMAIPETAAFVTADAGTGTSLEIKRAWWRQVFSEEVHEDFGKLRLINWFNWDKHEAEVDGEVSWSVTTDPQVAEAFREDLPSWVATGSDLPAAE